MKIRKSRFGLQELDLHLNYQLQNHNKFQCNYLDFIIAHGYTLNKISNWSLFKLIISDQALKSLKLIFA